VKRRLLFLCAALAGSLVTSALHVPAAAAERVTIATVPALEGIPIVVDKRAYRTNGLGRVTVDVSGPLRNRVLVGDARVGPRSRATFSRWYGNLDRAGANLTAALDLWFRFRWSFVDLKNRAVENERVTSVHFRSSHGRARKFKQDALGKWQWMQGSRVISTPEGPRRKNLYFTVEKVTVDKANVVNRAQQRFEPYRQEEIAIRLLFYSAQFKAQDALFKFPIGKGIKLTFPDGRVQYYELGPGATLKIDRLPRGEYWVEVDGPGMSFLRPVTLSRNQKVPLEVLSWVDIAFVFGVLCAIALGLLLVGRPWLLRYTKPTTYRGHWEALRARWSEGVL
jgi:hypothetical protein